MASRHGITKETNIMTFETITLSLPAHWLPAIVNDDPTGLDDAEHAALRRWTRDTVRELGAFHVGTVNNDTYFARYHDAAEYGVLACDCIDVDLCCAEQHEYA
jgi:hypothetical protein